jgi:hypothetical protein
MKTVDLFINLHKNVEVSELNVAFVNMYQFVNQICKACSEQLECSRLQIFLLDAAGDVPSQITDYGVYFY